MSNEQDLVGELKEVNIKIVATLMQLYADFYNVPIHDVERHALQQERLRNDGYKPNYVSISIRK